LDEHRVIDAFTERAVNGGQICLQAVGSKLDAIRETARKIMHEVTGGDRVTRADHPAGNELSISVNRDPSPYVAANAAFHLFDRNLFLLAADKGPDFITLNPVAG